MSGELISVQSTREADTLAVSTSGAFLPRIKLCQGQATEVLKKKIAHGGNFALIKTKDDIEDLGDEVLMIPLAGRAKALEIGDMIIANFEPNSPEFKRIIEESKVKDSGCMYGPEFLVWLPDQQLFVTLFLCNPTSRREGGSFNTRLKKGALLKSHLIETAKFSWFGPLCEDYSSPIANLPDLAEAQEQVTKFENEKSSKVRAEDS